MSTPHPWKGWQEWPMEECSNFMFPCISGQTTANTPSIERHTVKNVFAARRPPIVDRSWVREIKFRVRRYVLNILTYS